MPPIKSDTAVVSCPECGSKLAVSLSMVGRRARCSACKKAFRVPAPSDSLPTAAKSAAHEGETAANVPEHIGFSCRVCDTRMYARADQEGKPIKCADCGALTVVPPPPKAKPKNMPAALEGEQYELWEPGEQPLPSQLIAAQPKYIAIKCDRCGTLLQATEKQIGQQIACPDCNKKHIVPRPAQPVAKRSVLAPDKETPRLDPDAHPGERPFMSPPMPKMMHEEEQAEEYAAALEKSKRTGKPMEIDSRGRPIMPRWPLITGVLPFLFSVGIPVAWLGLSSGFVAAGALIWNGMQLAMQGEMAAVAGMCLLAFGVIIAMISTAAGSAVGMQIIMESSEGNRKIHHWPSLPDWFGYLLYSVMAVMTSAIPGFAISHIPPLNTMPGLDFLLSMVSIIFCMPIVLMSQLDINSPWGVASGRILASVARCPFSWAFFYLECILLTAICGGATYLVAKDRPGMIVWFLPVYVAALILIARLMGRLAWRLAEAMAIEG